MGYGKDKRAWAACGHTMEKRPEMSIGGLNDYGWRELRPHHTQMANFYDDEEVARTGLRVLRLADIDVDRFDLGVAQEIVDSALATDSTLLDPAKW